MLIFVDSGSSIVYLGAKGWKYLLLKKQMENSEGFVNLV